MEYGIFVIGIVALIVSVVISQKISKRSEEEITVLKKELESFVDVYTNTRLTNSHNYFQGQYDHLNQKVNEAIVKMQDKMADIEDLDSNLGDIDHDLDDAVDRIDNHESTLDDHEDRIGDIEKNIESHQQRLYEAESILEKLVDDIGVHNSQWAEEDYATYLENDSSVLKHIESTGYDISSIIIFMAYMLQDLKKKIYEKTINSSQAVFVPTNTSKRAKRTKDATVQSGI